MVDPRQSNPRLKTDPWSRYVAKAIGLFAPRAALNFLHSRAVLSHYTGASPKGPDQGWNPPNKSADAVLARDRTRLLARARDLERNSSHVSGAINKICNNVVYTGIFPQARLKTSDGKLHKAHNDRIEEGFQLWAEDDLVNFYDLQELFVRHSWIEGEFFLHRFWDEDLREKGLVPLGLEILETDFLDSSKNETGSSGNKVKNGIEYNLQGRPVAYWMFKEHPGDCLWGSTFNESVRIPATEIKHVFHRRRASQGRGVSWLASIIMEMRDFSEYQSSERIAARLAAAFGIFIESPYAEHQMTHPLAGTDQDTPSIADIPKYMEPGRIDVLPIGMKISAAQYNRPGQTYEPFTKTSLKSASTGSGLSYENFSNDYEGSTYSSARQAILEERRGYRKMQFFLNRHPNNWVWKSWIDYARLAQMLGSLPQRVPVQWQNPGWPWIDPQKDARGAQLELGMKITNRRRLAAERGLDWDEEIEELAEEEAILKEKKLNATEE